MSSVKWTQFGLGHSLIQAVQVKDDHRVSRTGSFYNTVGIYETFWNLEMHLDCGHGVCQIKHGTNICITASSQIWNFFEIRFNDLLMRVIFLWLPSRFPNVESLSFNKELFLFIFHLIFFDFFYKVHIITYKVHSTYWLFDRIPFV